MWKYAQDRPDLLLLLSLLTVILLHPALDHGDFRRVALGALTFVPVAIATFRLSDMKGWLRPAVSLMIGALIFSAAALIWPTPIIEGIRWALLSAFFAITVAALFSYLKNARSTTTMHLYTAASTYLLLGFLWFALYSSLNAFRPGVIQLSQNGVTDRSTELLYFSLVTLSTIGYGDVVPVGGEVRMLAALEGVTGVLYIAITVALLISGYKAQDQ
jgi:Ion channel